ncbi:hypothetical protein SANA_04980 [Gottschalkiaceae bacterium SANA]|nr:hypothetical protein SANA_04980 [Gottschalkiaceae bacterium SANA]
MSEMIRIRKVFFVWQEHLEEKWLTEMAAQGLHLQRVGFCVYDFKKGEPRDITYRLYSHVGFGRDVKACNRLFEDLGWEWLGSILSWQYFRKPHEEGKNDEILSDNQSKWEALKYWRNFTLAIGSLNLFNFLNISVFSSGLASWRSWGMDLFRLLILGLVGLLIYGAVKIQMRMNELKDSIL